MYCVSLGAMERSRPVSIQMNASEFGDKKRQLTSKLKLYKHNFRIISHSNNCHIM